MEKHTSEDPFWDLYQYGNKILRQRISKLDPKLTTKLRGIWLAAYKMLDFEIGKRRQGISHALAVDNNIGLVLGHLNLLENMKAIDLFVLSAAAVLHDLDKAMKKSDKYIHGPSGENQLQKLLVRLEFNLDAREAEAIGYLIACHDKGNFSKIPENLFTIGPPPGVLLRGLAAIFRLCDMLDLTYERCPEVIERIHGAAFQDAKRLWQATKIIGGWDFETSGRDILLQVIRKHSEEDELALRAIVDALNTDITPSHRKYLENCVIVSYEGKHINANLPAKFELDKIGLKFEPTGGLKELYDGILENYLKKLYKSVKHIDLNQVGIIVESRSTPLFDLFIQVKCKRSDAYRSLPIKLRNYESSTNNLPQKTVDVIARLVKFEVVPVSDVIENDKIGHLIVLGRAGSGKSTIAQYICLVLSRTKRKGMNLVPFKIPLRIFLSERNKRNGDYSLFDYVFDEINLIRGPQEHKCPRDFVEYCLKERGSLVILDGLDEIPNPIQRKEVCAEILEFMNNFENVRLVLTSRVDGYKEAPLSWAGFLHIELEPIEPESVEVFIEKWYKYREPDLRRREAKIAQFRRAEDDKSVKQLTANPLMLTIMAIINEKGPLPRLRTKLYDTCVTTYIEREGLKDLLWYDTDEVRSVHEDLGYWMHSRFESDEHQQEVNAENLKQELLEFLVSRSPLSRETQQEKVEKFVRLARNRIGLIVENRRGWFSFGLRSIQEFLAAQYIDDFKAYGIDDLWVFIDKKIFNPYWHEVVRFLVGIISQTAREQFLRKIIKEKSTAGIALASEIVIEKNPVSDNLRLEICKKCIKVVMSSSSEDILKTYTQLLIQLLESDSKDLILRQVEYESAKNPQASLGFSIFLKKSSWGFEQKQVDLIFASLTKPWKGKKLLAICGIILRRMAKETDGFKEKALLDILDVLSQSDEGHELILKEGQKLYREQAYYVALLLGNKPSLEDLNYLLRKRLDLP